MQNIWETRGIDAPGALMRPLLLKGEHNRRKEPKQKIWKLPDNQSWCKAEGLRFEINGHSLRESAWMVKMKPQSWRVQGVFEGIDFDYAGYLPSSLGPAALNSELDEPSASQRAPPQDVGPLGNGRGSPSQGALMPISKPKKQIKVGPRRLAPDIRRSYTPRSRVD